LDVFNDMGYAQILHGGSRDAPELLKLVIPTRDQSRIAAHMPLPIPTADLVAAEMIREEMSFELKKDFDEANGSDAQASG
jgi:hypothetical protein